MSQDPNDKRKASSEERPWYVKPITWKVIVLVLKIVEKVLDLIP